MRAENKRKTLRPVLQIGAATGAVLLLIGIAVGALTWQEWWPDSGLPEVQAIVTVRDGAVEILNVGTSVWLEFRVGLEEGYWSKRPKLGVDRPVRIPLSEFVREDGRRFPESGRTPRTVQIEMAGFQKYSEVPRYYEKARDGTRGPRPSD